MSILSFYIIRYLHFILHTCLFIFNTSFLLNSRFRFLNSLEKRKIITWDSDDVRNSSFLVSWRLTLFETAWLFSDHSLIYRCLFLFIFDSNSFHFVMIFIWKIHHDSFAICFFITQQKLETFSLVIQHSQKLWSNRDRSSIWHIE